ncbi:hypothetical protein FA13DRAFT_1738665 [Coprinellus micaceus]|uniref:Uncharacterized protein n=1 Tax=Coprinellus micaceus TaxID=71717 RepID=A0A4Y7ST51_COPMI|nr:hypothetical protein FA13DRAFT_1738665 [Coprinellus micaceus]
MSSGEESRWIDRTPILNSIKWENTEPNVALCPSRLHLGVCMAPHENLAKWDSALELTERPFGIAR